MYMRVVRFTDVDPDRFAARSAEISDADGPPEGVTATGMKMVHDTEQRTVTVIQMFATEEDMQSSAAVLEAMDPGDTPGTRASVDSGEVKVEVDG